jgi:hypothetical protein
MSTTSSSGWPTPADHRVPDLAIRFAEPMPGHTSSPRRNCLIAIEGEETPRCVPCPSCAECSQLVAAVSVIPVAPDWRLTPRPATLLGPVLQ